LINASHFNVCICHIYVCQWFIFVHILSISVCLSPYLSVCLSIYVCCLSCWFSTAGLLCYFSSFSADRLAFMFRGGDLSKILGEGRGEGPGLRPPLSLRQSSIFPSLSWAPWGFWAEPANPLPNSSMQFMQSNSLIKSTLMSNVLPGTEISVHAEFSRCGQN